MTPGSRDAYSCHAMAMYVALEGTDHEVRTGVWVTSVSTGLMIVPTSQKQGHKYYSTFRIQVEPYPDSTNLSPITLIDGIAS